MNNVWCVLHVDTLFSAFRFEVEVSFNIPNIELEPALDVAQTAIVDVANAVLEANRSKYILHTVQNVFENTVSYCCKAHFICKNFILGQGQISLSLTGKFVILK